MTGGGTGKIVRPTDVAQKPNSPPEVDITPKIPPVSVSKKLYPELDAEFEGSEKASNILLLCSWYRNWAAELVLFILVSVTNLFGLV